MGIYASVTYYNASHGIGIVHSRCQLGGQSPVSISRITNRYYRLPSSEDPDSTLEASQVSAPVMKHLL